MTKLIQQADVKQLICWLFGANLTLIGVIFSLLLYLHSSALNQLNGNQEDAKTERKEAKEERREIRKEINNLKIELAKITQ